MPYEVKYGRHIDNVRIFEGLQPHQVERILEKGRVLEFRGGETIFHQGMMGSNLFVVLRGDVELYDRTKKIAKLKQGDVFGEMAVLNRKPRNATAVALTDVQVFTLDEEQINTLLQKRVSVRLLLNVIHILSERLEEANAKLKALER